MAYPDWMTAAGRATMERGYYCPGETTPSEVYRRLASTAARLLDRPHLEAPFYDAMWKGWLCPASPVLSNFGHSRGMPISCFGIHPDDSVDSIFQKAHEQAMMSKHGGGVGVNLSDIRPRGSLITDNGTSEGVVPWAKLYDATVAAVSQGATRRGAASVTLPIGHPDLPEFLRLRRPEGDPNRQCLNLHHAVRVNGDFMRRVQAGDSEARTTWLNVLKTRLETGEPYIVFDDAMNGDRPPYYVQNDMQVTHTNICSEICLYTDPDHSFVCCLSSLNLAKYDEWKDTNLPELAIYFLDAVMTSFISSGKKVPGLEAAVRFAEKSRALGLGVLGWHTLLQQRGVPFDSFEAMSLNVEIFRSMRRRAEAASQELARNDGEPEWCEGTGRRNTHLMAVAPTLTNSTIAGQVSAGIEPIRANAYTFKTAKGTFFYRNPILTPHLEAAGINTANTWTDIAVNGGSVQHLALSDEVKQVFLTAPEINQMALVRQAGQRQKWVDQSQSLNLFFASDVPAKWFNQVHLAAWEAGVKTLYYVRSDSVLRADVASRAMSEACGACDG